MKLQMNNQVPLTESDEIIKKLLNIATKISKKSLDIDLRKTVFVHHKSKVFKSKVSIVRKKKVTPTETSSSRLFKKFIFPKRRLK